MNLAVVYDRKRYTDDVIAWYGKSIACDQDHCRFDVVEKKVQYLPQPGFSNQAVPIFESLLILPFKSEEEKERMRKTFQSLLGKAMRGWQ